MWTGPEGQLSARCSIRGRLYAIGLGRWRLMLLRLPTAGYISVRDESGAFVTGLSTQNLDICEWSSAGPSSKD
jgi:hypothetical protein